MIAKRDSEILVVGAEMASRVARCDCVDAIMGQAAATSQRPQHALVVLAFRRGPEGKMAAHQLDDIEASVGNRR